ncbi:MAG: nucleotidyl transferase AbiEii/AbiGii toxin family protein [bacterium]|nr:nucleotidyl transferase AbiEii/AbiGii toxin family protein [bacterium]
MSTGDMATHIAEKLHAYTLPRRRPNSRVKDLPDIALLATAGDIESVTLRQAIERIFEHRATHSVPEAVPDPPGTWGPVYERIAANDGLQWKTLADVTRAVQDFLNPVLAGESLTWKADEYAWSPSEAE